MALTTKAAIGLTGLVLAAPACTGRLIRDRQCGDGRITPGEVCLGEGTSSALRIDDLTPLSIRIAHFDSDDDPDLMVMGLDDQGLVAGRLWRGGQDETFEPPTDPLVSGCSAHPVPGPIDDDDIDDLLVDDCQTSVSLFRGTAAGVFEPPVTVFTGATTQSSGLLDLDEDGRREVVLFGADEAGTLVLTVTERAADGSFAPPVVSALDGLPPDFVPGGFGIFHFDGDGLPDALLVAGGRLEGIAVAPGVPGLGFGTPQLVAPAGLTPDWATPRDLDGDGQVEVLMASFEDEALIVLDVGDGALVERARTEVSDLEPGPQALADFDGDGNLDLLRVDAAAAALHVWLGGDDGRFSGPTAVDLDVPADQLAVADLDQDGAPDVVVGSFDQASLRVLMAAP